MNTMSLVEVEQQQIQAALLGDSAHNSNTGSKLRRAATVAIGVAVGIGIGCGVAVTHPNHTMGSTLLNGAHTMDPTLLYGASPVILQTPECKETWADSGNSPHVTFMASGYIPFTSGSPIRGPVTVAATGADGKCVTSMSLGGARISGPTWIDLPCSGSYGGGTYSTPRCAPTVHSTGQLTVGFHQCKGQSYASSSGKVFAQFLSNGATSWGSGPLAGTLTLTMEYNDGFCSEGITVNGQLVNSEKLWLDADEAGTTYDGIKSFATKTIQIGTPAPAPNEKHSPGTCASCVKGTHLNNNECIPNVCHCPNGTAAAGPTCSRDGDTRCSSCAAHYRLAGGVCKRVVCHCLDGRGARGAACPSQQAYKCTSCNEDYHLVGIKCVQNLNLTMLAIAANQSTR